MMPSAINVVRHWFAKWRWSNNGKQTDITSYFKYLYLVLCTLSAQKSALSYLPCSRSRQIHHLRSPEPCLPSSWNWTNLGTYQETQMLVFIFTDFLYYLAAIRHQHYLWTFVLLLKRPACWRIYKSK
jgi:hypothetical protein